MPWLTPMSIDSRSKGNCGCAFQSLQVLQVSLWSRSKHFSHFSTMVFNTIFLCSFFTNWKFGMRFLPVISLDTFCRKLRSIQNDCCSDWQWSTKLLQRLQWNLAAPSISRIPLLMKSHWSVNCVCMTAHDLTCLHAFQVNLRLERIHCFCNDSF